MKKLNLLVIIIFLFLIVFSLNSYSEVSHPAEQIKPGTFGGNFVADNFSFPDSISVTNVVSSSSVCIGVDCRSSWPSDSSNSGWQDSGSVVSLISSSDNVSANVFFVDNTNSRVGINTSSPSYVLDVVGTPKFSTDSVYSLRLLSSNSSNYISLSGGSSNLGLAVGTGDSTSYFIWNNASGQWRFYTRGGSLDDVKMVVEDTGNVGIGTVSPSYKLDVNGSVQAYGLYLDYPGSSSFITSLNNNISVAVGETTAIFVKYPSGYVGVGTTSPSSLLTVAGNVTPSVNDTYSLGSPDLMWKDIYVSSGTIYLGGKPLSLDDSGNLLFDGNQVETNVTSSSLWENVSGNATFTSGNVGIGTSSPDYALEVVGNVSLSNVLKVISPFSRERNISVPVPDVSSASYTGSNVSVGSEDSYPRGVFFSSDGSLMYVVGGNNAVVYEYSLSSAWDVSSASYTGKYADVYDEDSYPRGVFFSSDGSLLYVVGDYYNRVYEYSLSSAWDVSTASYTGKYADVSNEDSYPEGVFFSSDGSLMYVVGDYYNRVYEYSLSSAWDVSSASYTGKYVSVSSEDSYPEGVFFSSDGSLMYVVGAGNDAVYEYSLSFVSSNVSRVGVGGVVCINGLCDDSFGLSVSGGNVSGGLFVGYPYGVYARANSSSGWGVYCEGDYCGGTQAWTSSSDIRVKDDVVSLSDYVSGKGSVSDGKGSDSSVNVVGFVSKSVGGNNFVFDVSSSNSSSVLSKVLSAKPIVYKKDVRKLSELRFLNKLYSFSEINSSIKKFLIDKGLWNKLNEVPRDEWDPSWVDVLLEDEEFVSLVNSSSIFFDDEFSLLLNSSSSKSGDVEVGFSAQELKNIFPEVVVWDNASGTYGITYTELIPYLFEALKETNLRIDKLEGSDFVNSIKNNTIQNNNTTVTNFNNGCKFVSDDNGLHWVC